MVRIFNVSTSPISLALYNEDEVMFREFVLDPDTNRYFEEWKARKEPKITESVWIEGTHHERIHDPQYIDVSNDKFKAIQKCPLFDTLVASKRVRYEENPKD